MELPRKVSGDNRRNVFKFVLASKTNFRENDLVIGNEVRCRYVFAQHSQFMKFSLSLAFLVAFFLSSCSEEPPPQRRTRHPVANYPPPQTEQYPPQQQPFNPNGPVQPQGTPREAGAASPVPTAAPTKVAKGDYPYGIPVPGKPHLVESPFSPGKYVDVEGFPPGTEVKDPYTDKIFLVP